MLNVFKAVAMASIVTCLADGCRREPASQPGKRELPPSQPNTNAAINLLTDCSHDYSFQLGDASRTQREIFPGINCLASGRTIHKADLDPINALVVLVDGRLPYLPEDAPYLLDYVERGGGLYLGIDSGGRYADSVNEFLGEFGLQNAGPWLSKDPANWGISAHAPSELVFDIGGKYERFTSRVGSWADYAGTVSFEVYGDGKRLYQGKVLSKGERDAINVSVVGVGELRLVATDGGDGNRADGSIWFDPRVVTGSGKSERVLLKDAESIKVGWATATQDRHFNGKPLGVTRVANAKAGAEIVAARHPAALADAKLERRADLPQIRDTGGHGWEPVYTLGQDGAVMLARTYGHGVIVADMAGLYHAAVAKEEQASARAAMRKVLEYISAGKRVAAIEGGGGGWQFSDGYRWDLVETTDDGLRIHHNEYTKMYVTNDIRGYRETARYLHQLSGVDVKQKAAQIKELNAVKAKLQVGTRVDVDITGVQELTLITTDGGDNITSDHSIWAEAFFVDSAGREIPLRLEHASLIETGYGSAMEDAIDGLRPFSIGGRQFSSGILLHANGRMVVPVEGEYVRFKSWVGCNDTAYGSVGFKVIGDGKVLWDDGNVYLPGNPEPDPSDVNYVPEGVLFQLKYTAVVGCGFLVPQGAIVDLPPALEDDWQAHLGMFAHEMGHAWSYPFCEKMGEESSAFIFNNMVLHRHHGQRHGDAVTRRLVRYLEDKNLDGADLAVGRNDFKYYMFIDLMIREYGEDIWKNYNLLKYALLNKEGAQWTPHTTAWLWSIAAGRDVFPCFQTAFGSSVSAAKAKLPAKAIAAGFNPVAVGKLYDVPLVKLPQQRDIFSKLSTFADVRAFYKKEVAEKGHFKVEG